MGFLDRLLGRDREPPRDDRAIERYRYLLQTAPPEQIERAHEEAFAQLTPDERSEVLERLAAVTPEAERTPDDDPRSLARMATRAEMRQPGTLERSFDGRGLSLGGFAGGSMLGSIAGVVVGTVIAQQMFADDPAAGESAAGDAGTGYDHGGGFDGGGFDGGGLDGGGF